MAREALARGSVPSGVEVLRGPVCVDERGSAAAEEDGASVGLLLAAVVDLRVRKWVVNMVFVRASEGTVSCD